MLVCICRLISRVEWLLQKVPFGERGWSSSIPYHSDASPSNIPPPSLTLHSGGCPTIESLSCTILLHCITYFDNVLSKQMNDRKRNYMFTICAMPTFWGGAGESEREVIRVCSGHCEGAICGA